MFVGKFPLAKEVENRPEHSGSLVLGNRIRTKRRSSSINGLQSQHGKSPYGTIYSIGCHLALCFAATSQAARGYPQRLSSARTAVRSEERRVGKEGVSTCRLRGSPYHSQKTIITY